MPSGGRSDGLARVGPQAALWLAVLVGAGLRLVDLGLRPVHHDEAVNWYLLGRVLREGSYVYDPTNYHGPLHFQLGALARALLGTELWLQRLPLALAGVAVVVALAFAAGRDLRAALVAWLAACSPVLVYYARDAIHETWLALFTATALWGAARLVGGAGRGAAVALGLSLGGMVASKETCVLTFGAWSVGAVAAWVADREATRAAVAGLARWWREVGAVAGAVVVASYSNLGQTPGALLGLAQTLGVWGARGAEGGGHPHPASWHLHGLVHNEPVVVGLGVLGLLRVRCGRPVEALLAGWAVSLLVVYSLIPYKTPWLMVQMVLPWLLLAAVGAEAAVERSRSLGGLLALVAVLAGVLQSWRSSLVAHDDPAHRLAYVQTHRELPVLLGEVRAAVSGRGFVRSVHPATYPINWYLRGVELRREELALEQPLAAPAILYALRDEGVVWPRLTGRYVRKVGQFRQGMWMVALVDVAFADGLGPGWEPFEALGAWSTVAPEERWTGLRGAWFGAATPRGAPFRVEQVSSLDMAWSNDHEKPRSAPLFVRWEGWVELPSAGLYGMELRSDDGSQLWVDGELVLDHWGVHAPTVARTGVWLGEGLHHVGVVWFDLGGPGALRWRWQAPGEAWEVVEVGDGAPSPEPGVAP